MSNPEIQVNENPEAQQLNQEQQNTIKDINTLLADNNNKEISTINDLLNKEFLKWISAELAWQILDNIPDSLQNDPNIQKVVTVLRAKASASQISWNNSNLEDYSNNIWMDLNIGWSIDIWNFTIDLSTYKKDITGNSELYWLTGLTWELQQCLSLIGPSENLQNLKNNLEGIKNIIEGKSTKLNDLNKIEQFLINNQIRLESWNQNNIAPLLNWIHTFILNTAQKLSENRSNQEQANRILNEEEQRIKTEKEVADLERIERNIKLIEMSTAFSDIENKIPNDLGSLSKLNKKDIQNIKDFITESKSKDNISTHINAKESVFILYLKMYHCQQALNGSGITHRDRNNFDEVFKHITETFKDNEIQNYELWLQFKWINETNLKSAAPQNWDWKFLTDGNNNSFLQTICRWHLFQPKDYMDKFNSINRNRIENIIPQLQNYNISNFLQNFELNTSKDGLVPKNDKDHFSSLTDPEKSTTLQGILIKQVANTVTNLINWENEIKRIIWEYNGGKNANILTDWTNKIIEELKKQSDAPEWWNWNQEIGMTFENLPDLDTNSIKKVFSNLDKQDIVKFFNEQKARTDLTEQQKFWLTLAYKWLTKRFIDPNDNTNRWKESITVLQQYMKDNNESIVIDWKFGKQTFDELKRKFWINTNKTSIWKDISPANKEIKNSSIETKKVGTVNNLTELVNNLNNIWNDTINYIHPQTNVKFSFNKEWCTMRNTKWEQISFTKNWEQYINSEQWPSKNLIVKETSISIIDANNKWKKYYNNWNYFEWNFNENSTNPSKWTMKYPNWEIFEWKFQIKDNIVQKDDWKLTYKDGSSFEWKFIDWKKDVWIEKNNDSARIVWYNNDWTCSWLVIQKGWKKEYQFEAVQKNGTPSISSIWGYGEDCYGNKKIKSIYKGNQFIKFYLENSKVVCIRDTWDVLTWKSKLGGDILNKMQTSPKWAKKVFEYIKNEEININW